MTAVPHMHVRHVQIRHDLRCPGRFSLSAIGSIPSYLDHMAGKALHRLSENQAVPCAGGGSEWGDLAKLGQMATAAGGGDHQKADSSSFISMCDTQLLFKPALPDVLYDHAFL